MCLQSTPSPILSHLKVVILVDHIGLPLQITTQVEFCFSQVWEQLLLRPSTLLTEAPLVVLAYLVVSLIAPTFPYF